MKCPEKGSGKGLEHREGRGKSCENPPLLAPAARHESGLETMNTPCGVARGSVAGSAGDGYVT